MLGMIDMNSEFRIQKSESKKRDIYDRVFRFACRIVRLHRSIHRHSESRTIANQLLRCGTSIGSNLEEANAAHSRADFIAKTRISLKEARESHYWLRLIEATRLVSLQQIHPLVQEANEIVAILTSIVKNTTINSES